MFIVGISFRTDHLCKLRAVLINSLCIRNAKFCKLLNGRALYTQAGVVSLYRKYYDEGKEFIMLCTARFHRRHKVSFSCNKHLLIALDRRKLSRASVID